MKKVMGRMTMAEVLIGYGQTGLKQEVARCLGHHATAPVQIRLHIGFAIASVTY